MDTRNEVGQEPTDVLHNGNGDGDMTSVRDSPRKEDMPDLLRVDSSAETGGFRGAVDSTRKPSPPGQPPEDPNAQLAAELKLPNGPAISNGPAVADAKKKIPVESLSKEELIVQVKKQMVLLQKTKARYDELQKKFTDSERVVEPAVPTDDQSAVFRDKISFLEQELRQERELHRKAKEQVTKPQNSVADLELRDYQRTIAQLNEKVTVKEDCIQRVTEQLHNSEQLLLTKHRVVQEQTAQIDDLTVKTTRLENNLTDAHRENSDKARVISSLRDEITGLNEKICSLDSQLGSHSEEQSDLVRNFAKLQESVDGKERVIQQKNSEISRLTVDLRHSRGQHDAVLRDFEDYKVRAQVLLRQKDNVAENAQKQKDIEELVQKVSELDAELDSSKAMAEKLREEVKVEKSAGEAASRMFSSEKIRLEKMVLDGEVKIRSLESAQESTYQDQRRKIKAYEMEINSLKDLHGSTNEKLLDELRHLRAENESLRHSPSDPAILDKSDVSLTELRFTRSKSEDFEASRSRSGSAESSPVSELPSSVFNRTVSVSASENTQPFEKLIQSSIATTSARDIDQRRLVHLSELLHESESANVRLNDQIRLLKVELRRIEANTERDKHVNSLEYLKNVLMQFLTHRVAASEQEKLIEVMTTILKLTTEERQQLMKAASASYIPENIKSWGTYLNPWRAKDDG